MTTAATTDLAACLALVSEATPGGWASINSIPEEGVECFWIKAQPGVGICRGFTQEIGCVNGPQSDEQEANARLIPAAVNYLRTHGDTLQRALALLAAAEEGETFGVWKPIETAPKTGRTMILLLPPSRFPQVAWSNTWWTAGFGVECKPTHWHAIEQVDAIDAARGEEFL